MTKDEDLVILDVDEIIEIHDQCIDKYDGSFGVRDTGLLQSATYSPYNSFGGSCQYPSLGEFRFTAKYCLQC